MPSRVNDNAHRSALRFGAAIPGNVVLFRRRYRVQLTEAERSGAAPMDGGEAANASL
jgi:hypothetical protein